MMPRTLGSGLVFALVTACGGVDGQTGSGRLAERAVEARGADDGPAASSSVQSRYLRLSTGVVGLSGLTVDGEGTLWAIAEEERTVVRIDAESGEGQSFPIVGSIPCVEMESIAWVRGGRFVVGTEQSGDGRYEDALVYLEREGDHFVIADQLSCPYSQWNLLAQDNRGLEGICAFEDMVMVASEVVRVEGSTRYGPLALRDGSGQWHAFELPLSSSTGKIAGLTCQGYEGDLRVTAIERHFGVFRLVHFVLDLETWQPVLETMQVRVLDDWLTAQTDSPNLEGIARLHERELALIVDNYYHGARQGDGGLYFLVDPFPRDAP